jgi:endoglucanase
MRRVWSNRKTMSLKGLVSLLLLIGMEVSCAAQEWSPLWQRYTSGFLDNQIRVIDRDGDDRTTSEAQAYAMFFALVANDRSRFDDLLRWTELNLASGDINAHLPAWLWGRGRNNQWGVLDANPASDADVWMAYTLLEAGRAWNEPRYTSIGSALAERIANEEVMEIAGVGMVLMPAPKGFRQGETYRLNASYMPLQVFVRLGHLLPDGPWGKIAEGIPTVVRASAPHGFATDWIEFSPGQGFKPSEFGSFDAIRVYLWAGMLDPATPGRDVILSALPGMADWLRTNATPPESVKSDGTVAKTGGPVGFSAALLPYLSASSDKRLEQAQLEHLRAAFDPENGFYGRPARYYDQNLTLFALGWRERRFWFDSRGVLNTSWKHD